MGKFNLGGIIEGYQATKTPTVEGGNDRSINRMILTNGVSMKSLFGGKIGSTNADASDITRKKN